MPRNYGLVIEPLKPEDYVFGGESKLSGEVINPSGDWLPYIPQFEHQAPGFETNSCVTHGTLNAFEGLNKLIFGTEPNLSDRFVAKTSGTDPKHGNAPQKVAEAFRKHWSVFEEEYPRDVKSAEEFYKDIPDLLYSKAQIVKGKDVFGYEAIQNPTKIKLQEALTKGAVGMSVFAWTQDDNDLYFKPEGFTDNHWVWLVQIKQNGNYIVFDSYSPSLKEIRADFIPQVAYRYTLNEERIDPIIRAINAIKALIAKLLSTPKPEPKPAPANNLLNTLILIMRKHEGWILNPPSRSVRNNNPLNCRFSPVGYLPIYGTVRRDPDNFAIFETYEIGHLYAKNLILQKAKKHPDWNLVQFIGDEYEGWAPASDNNDVDRYATVLAQGLGVSKTAWKLGNLLS